MSRRAGILLHPTCLPSPYGIGDFGNEAFEFVDFLNQAGQRLWQILPLTISDHTGSPYASVSAMAGNWLLISPDELEKDGLLAKNDLPKIIPVKNTNYAKIPGERAVVLHKSLQYFQAKGVSRLKKEFSSFIKNESGWLEDFSLFMALKDYFNYQPWHRWPKSLANRQPKSLRVWQKKLRKKILFYQYGQWLFFRQWYRLINYAAKKSVSIIGDLPFFVARDSVDVWVNKKLFQLDKRGLAKFISGVPPDYFSAKGQIWGDPQYDWKFLEQTNFDWWIKRLAVAFELYDRIRLDHFRGYRAVWYIRRGEHTARRGKWVEVPGEKLFAAVKNKLHKLPFIAEDLGVITDDVVALREQLGFPSTRVLQFSFDGRLKNTHRPENYMNNVIVYTGTHDNDTARGWITNSGKPKEVRNALRETKAAPDKFAWKLIKTGMRSKAGTFMAPLQDILNLGSEARFNKPATKRKNWRWRIKPGALTDRLAQQLKTLTKSAKR